MYTEGTSLLFLYTRCCGDIVIISLNWTKGNHRLETLYRTNVLKSRGILSGDLPIRLLPHETLATQGSSQAAKTGRQTWPKDRPGWHIHPSPWTERSLANGRYALLDSHPAFPTLPLLDFLRYWQSPGILSINDLLITNLNWLKSHAEYFFRKQNRLPEGE